MRIPTSLGCLLIGVAAAAQTPLYRDINATQVNAQMRRTELVFYPTELQARTLGFEQSPFYSCLNGEWDFAYFSSEEEIPAEISKWTKIRVPGNMEVQGFGTPVYVNIRYDFEPENPQPPIIPEMDPVGVYRRNFTVPAEWKGREIYLNLCGAKSGVYTYINGKEIGYSEDAKDLVRFDITPYLKDGENELRIRCYRWSSGSYMEDQDFWRLSGIERDVYLSSEQVKDCMDFGVVSTLAEDFSTGIFNLDVQSSLPTSYKLLDSDGKVVAEGSGSVKGLRIPGVRTWTAETPELYKLILKIGQEYTRFDVGFRKLEIKGNVFYLNGMPIKFKGVNMHEHNEFTGHYVTRDYVLANLKRMRELNINAIRTCHYPQPRFFYELCDSLGFYVYDEANVETHGMGYGERSLAKDPAWFAKHEDRILNMYMRTRNYPCVTLFSLGNEAGDGINFTRMYKALKDMETKGQNRPVVYERAEGGANTDFLNPMYPYTDFFIKQAGVSEKPVAVCEYAHAMGNSTGSLDLSWDVIYKYDNLQGGFIWDWMDQGLAEFDVRGNKWWAYGGDYGDPGKDPEGWWADRNFCCNGLVNPDLSVHPGGWEVKHQYQEASVDFAPVDEPGDSSAFSKFVLKNRYYFKSLDNDLHWEIIEDGAVIAGGKQHFTTAPQSGEVFGICIPEMDKYKTYHVNFRLLTPAATELLPEGYAIATDQLLLRRADEKPVKLIPYKVKIRTRGDRIVLKGRGARLVVNAATGVVEQYRLGCSNVFLKGFGLKPEFWRAPIDNEWGNDGPIKRYAAWKNAAGVVAAVKDADEFGGAVTITYALPDGCSMDVAYNLISGGSLRIDAYFHGGDKHVDIPRIGFRTRLKAGCDSFSYLGRGPEENYCDRFSAYWVGIYESSAKAEAFPYVRPQETGHHTDVEWLSIGKVCISGAKPFEFNALRCSVEDLDPRDADGNRIWGHINDIPVRPYVELCLDGFMTGVGGYDSWGARPEPSRTIWADSDYEFSLTFAKK